MEVVFSTALEHRLLPAGAILALAVLAAVASQRLRLPLLITFLGLGMLLGSEGIGGIDFDDASLARTIGILALIAILFEGGLTSDWREIRPVAVSVFLLSTIGVLVTAALTAVAAYYLFDLSHVGALLLGAVVGSTDAAAVFATLRNTALPHRVVGLLHAESGANDPMAVALTIGFISWLTKPSFGVDDIVVLIVRQLGLGLVVGLALGWIASRLFPLLPARLVAGGHMPDRLEIRVLGPFEVVAGGSPADVGGSKRQALLAMLALGSGRVVGVDMLVDGLWGAELPAAPRNALHHHVARLRAALGEDAIGGSADGYALHGALVDALRFEELLAETRGALRDGDVGGAADSVASALDLWRGPALQGLTGTAWFSAEARRLETLRVDALEERFEVALALGEHRELASALRAALADNPFRERLWAQLMLALYRSGRQAEALETFQEARRVLADELGLEPGPDLRRLQEAILAHDPAIAAVPVDRRRRSNLPAAATSFVGREEELGHVAALLHEHRLVTLTGPPGVGKSRLAVETARSLEDEFPDGIWLVDFARAGAAVDAGRLLANVVDARGADPLKRVASRLRSAEALLVLDACEHVLDEAARVVSTLLAECSRLRILATSRETLHAAGEVRLPVAPLGVAAVDLFLERARAARPGFQTDGDAAALAAEIARRLDGLPLAIELAAARVNVLGLGEIISILERRAAVLRDSPASDPSRIALRGLVEWSYDLLHADEKTLLQQLAVHRGGASLASLAAVAATRGLNDATVAYLVSALVDKSIVSASFSGGTARYDMLDTVREYVLERLDEGGRLDTARHAQADYFAALAEEAWAGLRGPAWLDWEGRLQLENDNLWAALDYAREASDERGAVEQRPGGVTLRHGLRPAAGRTQTVPASDRRRSRRLM